jgi:lactoylglutathione lyase
MSMDSPAGAEGTQPEPFHALALAASLTVKDLDASLAWYRDVVGFTVDQQHERQGKVVAVAVRAGDVRILLNQDNGARGWDRVKGEGFSLQITTSQDVDAIAERIRARGGTLDSEPADMPWGARVFRLVDPDGFRFTITSMRPAPPKPA